MSRSQTTSRQSFQTSNGCLLNKPIWIAQLMPHLPRIHGYVDACRNGMGGGLDYSIGFRPSLAYHLVYWHSRQPEASLQQKHRDNQRLRNGRNSLCMAHPWKHSPFHPQRSCRDSMRQHIVSSLVQKIHSTIKNSGTLASCTGTLTTALRLGPTAGLLDSWQWQQNGRCCVSVQLSFKIASTLTRTFKNFQHIFPTGNFLGGIPLATKIDFTRDVVSAWKTIDLGVVAATTKTWEKYWQTWCQYAKKVKVNPLLQSTHPLVRDLVLTAFAVWVRTGFYGKGSQIRVQGVTDALLAISKTIELAGLKSPVYQSHNKYNLQIERCVEGWRRQDPPLTL